MIYALFTLSQDVEAVWCLVLQGFATAGLARTFTRVEAETTLHY